MILDWKPMKLSKVEGKTSCPFEHGNSRAIDKTDSPFECTETLIIGSVLLGSRYMRPVLTK